jgi:hypothetical protein
MRTLYKALLLAAPAALLAVIAFGCSNPPATTPSDETTNPPEKKELTELENTTWGTLKGKVTLDGPPPGNLKQENDSLHAQMDMNPDKKRCMEAPEDQRDEQEWRINGDAVQNVVVFLRPPEGKYFKVDMKDPNYEAATKEVVIHQPFCAFMPHVSVLFPSYYDAKAKEKDHQKATGQTAKVINDAPMKHNTAWDGGAKNPGTNQTLDQGKDLPLSPIHPNYSAPVKLSCNIHKWMNGYAWVFDHPYAAVTNDKGEYEIKHVPAGVDLQVVAWHEKANFLEGGAKGIKKKFTDGDNTADWKVKAQ